MATNEHELTKLLRSQLQHAADADIAPGMQAYLKTDQPFYGVKAPVRAQLFKEAKRAFPKLSPDEYDQVVRELWQGTHRERRDGSRQPELRTEASRIVGNRESQLPVPKCRQSSRAT